MDNGDIENESSLEDCSVKVVEPLHGDVEQDEHIVNTRCHINYKACSMIIDSGSCTNVVSTFLVEKLNLATKKIS